MTKTDFDAKLSTLNRKITSNKARHLLTENELKKLKAFDQQWETEQPKTHLKGLKVNLFGHFYIPFFIFFRPEKIIY